MREFSDRELNVMDIVLVSCLADELYRDLFFDDIKGIVKTVREERSMREKK